MEELRSKYLVGILEDLSGFFALLSRIKLLDGGLDIILTHPCYDEWMTVGLPDPGL